MVEEDFISFKIYRIQSPLDDTRYEFAYLCRLGNEYLMYNFNERRFDLMPHEDIKYVFDTELSKYYDDISKEDILEICDEAVNKYSDEWYVMASNQYLKLKRKLKLDKILL